MPSESTLIRKMLAAKRIALVGISDDPRRPSYQVAQYLIQVGYELIFVNPALTVVQGLPCYPSLGDVPGTVELVNIFRRSEFIPDLITQSIEIKAPAVWVQSGLRSDAAAAAATAAGIDYIQDRCIKIEHARLQLPNHRARAGD